MAAGRGGSVVRIVGMLKTDNYLSGYPFIG